jgi:proteasome lid subunit RPN8/RPN11
LAAEVLMREGFGAHWTIIDHDLLFPHNLARHTLGTFEVGLSKALSLADRIKSLRAGVSAEAIIANVLDPGIARDAVEAAVGQADLIIDAAASVPVARFLSDHPGTGRRASIFFNPSGTSVVLIMEDKDRATDLRLLEARYYGEILRVPDLHDHLTRSSGTVPYAGACRAVTNRIPASRAQALTGLVAMALTDALDRPAGALKIWSLSNDGSPAAHSAAIDDVRVVSILGWTITLPRCLEDAILRMRAVKLPAETGGVLFGVVDLVKARIDVVEAWPQPLGSSGSETKFVRGTKGLRPAVASAIGRTLDQVRYVGEWHSHPRRARTSPSNTDLDQIFWLTSTLAADGCPGLMLIAGDAGVSINLGDVIKPDTPAT